MSWLFSQVLVEEYLGVTSLDGEPSAPLSGSHIQQAYCAPDKMTKFFRLSRYGMTVKPLTDTRGEELLTLYLEDFHARTSAQRGGGGIEGPKSSMWKHMARIIGEVRPQYVFVENSPMLTSRGLGVVLADLSTLGFDAKWGVVSAADIGANHQRERIWIRAEQKRNVAYASSARLQRYGNARINDESIQKKRWSWGGFDCGSNTWWEAEPNILRVADGVAARVDRLKAIGNGQVPLCAATAWELLK